MIPFPNKKYNIIYSDPAWQYKENWGNGSNEHTYSTMKTDDIKNLPVKNITNDKAHLYLWVTNPFIKEGLEICKEWGFEYKTLITWIKTYKDGNPEMGMGYYFRSCTEHIIFVVKGKMKCLNKNTRNMIKDMGKLWGEKIDSKTLFDLFPGNPSKQAGRIGGLPESRRKGGY